MVVAYVAIWLAVMLIVAGAVLALIVLELVALLREDREP